MQAQILNLLRDLQRDLGVSYLFTAKNIGVVEYGADRLGVMKAEHVQEQGTAPKCRRGRGAVHAAVAGGGAEVGDDLIGGLIDGLPPICGLLVLHHQQVLLCSTVHAGQRDALVEADPATLVAHGQRQQVQVRDLVAPLHACEVEKFVVLQAHIVGSKGVVEFTAGLAQPFSDLLDGGRATAAVVG